MNLEELAYHLNTYESDAGANFAAEYNEATETLKVTCDLDPEAVIFVVGSEEQILSVTPLFQLSDVAPELHGELYQTLLQISPVIPLSSVGIQNDACILFGAMPVSTSFKDIAHELECQADNYNDVLDALSDFFGSNQAVKEA